MLTKQQFQQKLTEGYCILDGATGSNLRNAGMPKGCCAEQWILEHPEPLVPHSAVYDQTDKLYQPPAERLADRFCQLISLLKK